MGAAGVLRVWGLPYADFLRGWVTRDLQYSAKVRIVSGAHGLYSSFGGAQFGRRHRNQAH
jgi:hypothetical protein